MKRNLTQERVKKFDSFFNELYKQGLIKSGEEFTSRAIMDLISSDLNKEYRDLCLGEVRGNLVYILKHSKHFTPVGDIVKGKMTVWKYSVRAKKIGDIEVPVKQNIEEYRSKITKEREKEEIKRIFKALLDSLSALHESYKDLDERIKAIEERLAKQTEIKQKSFYERFITRRNKNVEK